MIICVSLCLRWVGVCLPFACCLRSDCRLFACRLRAYKGFSPFLIVCALCVPAVLCVPNVPAGFSQRPLFPFVSLGGIPYHMKTDLLGNSRMCQVVGASLLDLSPPQPLHTLGRHSFISFLC